LVRFNDQPILIILFIVSFLADFVLFSPFLYKNYSVGPYYETKIKAMEGEKIPKEKLQQEIVAPYKQNWIGLMSVAVIILATIISQNPEIFESPMIPIPDL
jgi:hypothetical protein